MVYKKFVKKGNRIFGPYYYESYRDGNKVKKIYIGGEKEYKSFLRKKKFNFLKEKKFSFVEQPFKIFNSDKKNIKIFRMFLFFIFLFILVFILIFGFIFFYKKSNDLSLRFSGFVISENVSDMLNNSLYLKYKKEFVESSYNTSNVLLEVRVPETAENIINKNKILDFKTNYGDVIRLYFDLLNYSEFIENVAQTFYSENITNFTFFVNYTLKQPNETLNQFNETKIITNFTINDTNVTIPEINYTVNQTINETNVIKPEVNVSENLTELENATNNKENLEKNNSFESINNTTQESLYTNESESETISENFVESSGLSITGNTIRNLFIITDRLISGFFIITAKVVGIDVNASFFKEPDENNFNETSNIINQTYEIKEVSLGDIKKVLTEVENEKINELSESSKVIAENFDIIINKTPNIEESKFKWGYKVKLKDLKFLAKIEITSNKSILIYDNESLVIGDSYLITFKDLILQGYNIKFEKPLLEIPIDNVTLVKNITQITVIVQDENFSKTENITSDENQFLNKTYENLINETNLENDSDLLLNTSADYVNREKDNKENIDKKTSKENIEEKDNLGITGKIIKTISKITSRVIDSNSYNYNNIENIKYNSTFVVYIERDFSNSSYKIGDIINLDPELILLEEQKPKINVTAFATTKRWNVKYSNDKDYEVYIENNNKRNTEICLIPKNESKFKS
ncbi:MAG: hypothetical protein QXW97_04650, partial [Candidatus Pacearchaeota archaeon]